MAHTERDICCQDVVLAKVAIDPFARKRGERVMGAAKSGAAIEPGRKAKINLSLPIDVAGNPSHYRSSHRPPDAISNCSRPRPATLL